VIIICNRTISSILCIW